MTTGRPTKPLLSLKERLVLYLMKRHSEYMASGDLQRIVAKYTDYTPRTVVRRLEELVNENRLEVQYRKGHAFYRVKDESRPRTQSELLATNPQRLKDFELMK